MKAHSLFAFLYLVSCAVTAQVQAVDDCSIAEHFSRNALDPHILINNIHLSEPMDGQKEQIIHLGNYTFKWINTEEEEVEIKIGEDTFSLKGRKRLTIRKIPKRVKLILPITGNRQGFTIITDGN